MTQSLNPIFSKITVSKKDSPLPLYAQLANQIESLIRDGFLKENDQLPSTRVLSQLLSLSRVTVNQAYCKLIDEGWIISKQGSGSFVSANSKTILSMGQIPGPKLSSDLKQILPKRAYIAENSLRFKVQKEMPLALTAPDLESLPKKEWTKIVARLSKSPWRHNSYAPPGGYKPFRKAIANHLRKFRGINCDFSQVIITSGIQEGLNLATQALFTPGSSFAVEEPYFIPHKDLLELQGLSLSYIPVDEQGIQVESLRSLNKISGVLVTPCHQFPTGYLMSAQRKFELIHWASMQGAWILENDFDCELFTGLETCPSIASLDRTGSTIYMGSFTKTIYPGFNMGYIVVPPKLAIIFEGLKHLNMRHSSEVHSTILTEFIENNDYEAHVRHLKRIYSQRRNLSCQLIKTYLSEYGSIDDRAGGSHLTLVFKRPIDDIALSKYLVIHHRIETHPLSAFYSGPEKKYGLILGFIHFNEDELKRTYPRLSIGIQKFLKL